MEREIFETAAAVNPETIPTLRRVCHRIHAWLEPLLYSMVIATTYTDPVLKAIQSKSPTFLQTAARHVFLSGGAVEVAPKHLLINCSGIDSLFLDACVHPSTFGLLAKTPIRRLNLSVRHDDSSILKQSMFLSISHLNWEGWSLLASLPALTHLCLSETLSISLLNDVLAECPRLRVAITAFWLEAAADDALIFANELATKDPRAVGMPPLDYGKGGAWQ